MADYSDRSGGAQGAVQAQIYPAADEIVKRQRNEAMDRCARLEADLDSARAMISHQSAEIVRLAEKLQGQGQDNIGDRTGSLFPGVYGFKTFDRSKINEDQRATMTEEQRRALDIANSSVQ